MKSFKEFFKEETTASGGNIGGLGFISGTPAVNQNVVANYVAQNTADSDQKNNILGVKYKEHVKDHNVVGFKSFDPKEIKKGKK